MAQAQAKRLRQSMAPPENLLWQALRKNIHGLCFRRQHPAGRFVLDLFCAPARMAVEVDGEMHERGDRPAHDAARDRALLEAGVRTLRYPARDVLAETHAVARQMLAIAAERRELFAMERRPPPPSPSAPPPRGGGG